MLLLVLIWQGVSHWQMQQALRWWFSREVVDRATLSDQIQNGIMQDLFAIRLGLTADSNQEILPSQFDALIAADMLYQRLSHLSTTLTPTYASESLPHAIQSLLQQWQGAHPHSQMQLDLGVVWESESAEQNQIVLAVLETLLQLSDPVASVSLSLTNQSQQRWMGDTAGKAKLTVKLTYADKTKGIAATRAQELKYLRDCFRCLMPGWCNYHTQSQEDTWQFCWRVAPFNH